MSSEEWMTVCRYIVGNPSQLNLPIPLRAGIKVWAMTTATAREQKSDTVGPATRTAGVLT